MKKILGASLVLFLSVIALSSVVDATSLLSNKKLSTRDLNVCVPTTTAPVVITTTGTGNWVVPYCWNTLAVQVLAGGGSGAASAATNYAGGGSGAAFSQSTISVTTGSSIPYGVGTGGAARSIPSGSGVAGNNGADSWFGAASFAACTNPSLCASAKAGLAGQPGIPAPLVNGGAASGGVGQIKFSGGNAGGGVSTGGSGGGGAAGPNGNGVASPTPTSFVPGPGGAGDNGLGGAGAAGGSNNGGNGTEWACGIGSGGGGGGTTASSATAGSGGLYGAGGGAASGGGNFPNVSGAGTQGAICIYRLSSLPIPANDNNSLSSSNVA